MKESALNISMYTDWINEYKGRSTEEEPRKLEWAANRYNEILKLNHLYAQSTKLLGCLYLYFNGYKLQSELDNIFWKLRNGDWETKSYITTWDKTEEIQNKAIDHLIEIKKEINALSTYRPRPIRFLIVAKHTWWDIKTYNCRRYCRNHFKRFYKKFKKRFVTAPRLLGKSR